MVTKCDLVAGFTEYFDDLTQEARAQVWGVTFPYEQTRQRRGAAGVPGGVRRADGAAERARVRARSRRSATPARRTRIFAFPQQMAALRDALDAVRQRRLRVDALRPADPAARRVLHQRHAGRHADRSPARRASAARFGVAPERGRAAGRPRQGVLRRAAAQGRDVRRVGPGRRQPAARGAEGVAAARRLRGAGLVAAAAVAALSVSYARNRDFLEQVGDAIGVFDQTAQVDRSRR